MKKILFVTLFFVCTVTTLQRVAAQSWEWAKASSQCVGPNMVIEAGSTVLDPHANVYVTGRGAGDCMIFGTDTIPNLFPGSGTPIFLVSYDSSGNMRWVRTPNSALNNAQSVNIAADDSGNIYMAGLFYETTITFGTVTLTGPSGGSIFLVKYDSLGNVLWAKTAGGTPSYCEVATAHDGSVYLSGYFYSGSVTFGSHTVTNSSPGSDDLFLVKYNTAGSVVWAKGSGGTASDLAYNINCDINGNVYMTGLFQSPTLAFGSTTLVNTDPTHSDMFIAKFDSSGTPVWATQINVAQDPGSAWPFPVVATDNSGNLYATEQFETHSLVIGPYHFINVNPAIYLTDMFVAKYDPSGTLLWAKHGGGINTDLGFHFAFDPAGNTWLSCGSTSPSVTFDTAHITIPYSMDNDASFLVAFDPSGRIAKIITLRSGGDDELGIAVDKAGNIYIGGDYIGGPIYIGTDTLDTTGGENFFVAKYSANLDLSTLHASHTIPASDITVYPNPADNALTIVCNTPVSMGDNVRIINTLGQTLKTVSISGKTTEVNTADIPGGLYICRIEINGVMTVQKILINH